MLPESPLLGLNCFRLILVMNENACFPTASPAWYLVKLLDICQYDAYHYLTAEKAMAPHSSNFCLENPMDGGAC